MNQAIQCLAKAEKTIKTADSRLAVADGRIGRGSGAQGAAKTGVLAEAKYLIELATQELNVAKEAVSSLLNQELRQQSEL